MITNLSILVIAIAVSVNSIALIKVLKRVKRLEK